MTAYLSVRVARVTKARREAPALLRVDKHEVVAARVVGLTLEHHVVEVGQDGAAVLERLHIKRGHRRGKQLS